MIYEIVKEQSKHTGSRARELPGIHNIEDQDRTNAKHVLFLAMLKKQYGYTNEKAVDELERILKLFYAMNRSLGIRSVRTNYKHPDAVA